MSNSYRALVSTCRSLPKLELHVWLFYGKLIKAYAMSAGGIKEVVLLTTLLEIKSGELLNRREERRRLIKTEAFIKVFLNY